VNESEGGSIRLFECITDKWPSRKLTSIVEQQHYQLSAETVSVGVDLTAASRNFSELSHIPKGHRQPICYWKEICRQHIRGTPFTCAFGLVRTHRSRYGCPKSASVAPPTDAQQSTSNYQLAVFDVTFAMQRKAETAAGIEDTAASCGESLMNSARLEHRKLGSEC
jgi:hypothetical protein